MEVKMNAKLVFSNWWLELGIWQFIMVIVTLATFFISFLATRDVAIATGWAAGVALIVGLIFAVITGMPVAMVLIIIIPSFCCFIATGIGTILVASLTTVSAALIISAVVSDELESNYFTLFCSYIVYYLIILLPINAFI
jgi:hypothetical protein